MIRLLNFVAIGLVFSAGAAAAELPTKIAPGDPKIQLQGAWTATFDAAWTGTGLRFSTDAVKVNLLMHDHAPGGEHPVKGNRNNYLAIQIDDGEPHVLSLEKDVERYPIPGLDGQPHTVTIFKRTEPLFRHITFKGLELPEGQTLLDPPAPAKVRLQVIGDSISAGYGNEGAGVKDTFKHCEQNGWMTYWAIAGRKLGADVRCAAWSGKGAYRDRQNNTDEQLPEIWRLALPYAGHHVPERDDADWIPTLVVINLGTNDLAKGMPEEEDFITAYRGLIADVRKDAPDVPIYCVFGPMISQKSHGQMLEYLQTIAADDPNTHVIRLHNEHGMAGFGAHWHPTVLSHQSMADQLLKAIEANP